MCDKEKQIITAYNLLNDLFIIIVVVNVFKVKRKKILPDYF